jgi:LacI family transcriptional regulator
MTHTTRRRTNGTKPRPTISDELLAVPVTVVAYDAAELSRKATELLGQRLAGDETPTQRIVLRTALIVRGSGGVKP